MASNIITLNTRRRRSSGIGAIRTGAFYATPVAQSHNVVGEMTWVVRCDWLPDWGHVVDGAIEDQVARMVQQIQAENRRDA